MKKAIIIGDSYSTYKGYLPEGYRTHYPTADVDDVDKTWWRRLCERTGLQMVQNNSWSGSPLGFTGYNGDDCSRSGSFFARYRELKTNGFFEKNKIDTVFVFGGTNDSWADAPLGEEQYEDFHHEDLFCVLPAICYFMGELRRNHPTARVVFIANCDIKPEIIEGMKNAAARLGAECIALHDIDKECGHPTVRGMAQICEQVLAGLRE